MIKAWAIWMLTRENEKAIPIFGPLLYGMAVITDYSVTITRMCVVICPVCHLMKSKQICEATIRSRVSLFEKELSHTHIIYR
jgi:hypothetical protein